MKTMKCSQLGGPLNCNETFSGETFDEIAEKSQAHGKKMFEENDQAHLMAMQEMGKKMMTPEAMKKWMEEREKEFDALPDDK